MKNWLIIDIKIHKFHKNLSIKIIIFYFCDNHYPYNYDSYHHHFYDHYLYNFFDFYHFYDHNLFGYPHISDILSISDGYLRRIIRAILLGSCY